MKLLLSLLLICFSLQSFAQMDSIEMKPAKGSSKWHLSQKKSLKTAGFLLLTGGTILTLVSLNSVVTFDLFLTEEEKQKEKAAYTRAWIGIGAMVASVPLFFLANSHKKKARLMFKNEKAFLPDPSQRINFTAMAIALKF